MPSNKELISEAQDLSGELNLAIDTDGLKNDALVSLVSDLRAKKRDADTDTQADELQSSGPVVAQGRAVTTRRGVLGPGEAIFAKDVTGGDKTLQNLIKAGIVVA